MNEKSYEIVKRELTFPAYLTEKAFVIIKKWVNEEELEEHKKFLRVMPKLNPDYVFGKIKSFSVYRENDNKLYLPKHYGISVYGEPGDVRLPKTIKISSSIKFNGELREKQIKPVRKCLERFSKGYGGGVLHLGTGSGKCLGIDTPIIMYNGTIKKVQDIVIGDKLMGDNSEPRTVLNLGRGKSKMYRIKPNKGDSYVVNEDHILCLKVTYFMNKKNPKGSIIEIPVKEYINKSKGFKHYTKGYRVGVEFPYKEVPFNSYIIGYWLGDGSSYHSRITTQESKVLLYLNNKIREYDLYLTYISQYDYSIRSITRARSNIFLNTLKDLNMLKNKHIPDIYKYNSRQVRLEVLAGLIDSDGHVHQNIIEIIQKSEKLIDDIIYLARSLGFACYKKICRKTCTNGKNGPVTGTYYRINIHGSGLEEIPVLLDRKKCTSRRQIKDALVTGITVEPLGIDNYYGFEIDGNGRFLLGDFTVTHNTTISLYILSVLRVKTLIIVHKEFLLNQWRERIKQFLPDAKIGHIQQSKMDSEGCDIVLGMLQSIAFKDDYPESLFRGFGLIIIDEVHHISAEYYSRTLFKCSAPYTLGLSATPNRPDGLERVFEWHSGPIIYKGKMKIRGLRPNVHFYNYTLRESKFCKEVLNFRKKPNVSVMITNVTLEPMRNKFIIDRVKLIVKKDSERHILLLTERRAHIEHLKKELDEDEDFKGTCGIYMGQVKQKILDESVKATVILGTISMIKEGFDVPSLDTLILATSKGDIDQMVGRILRKEHTEKAPMIIDIADTFSSFGRQGEKRRVFYRKRGYKIFVYDILDNIEVNRYIDDESGSKSKEKGKDKAKIIEVDDNQMKITDYKFDEEA